MKKPEGLLSISVFIILGFLLMGIGSVVYFLYDLQYPNHLIGDMYGVEVMIRIRWPVVATIVMLWGTSRFVRALKEKRKGWRVAGAIAVMFSASVLLGTALHTSSSRRQWELRQGYTLRSVEELLHIARNDDEESVWAINALQMKKNPEAVAGLREILLDETEMVNLRVGAAHALGEIGTEQARKALEKVRASGANRHVMIAVKYALEVRMHQENGPKNSRIDELHTETFAAIAGTQQSGDNAVMNKMLDDRRRSILGASVTDDGQIMVVTKELDEGKSTGQYVIRYICCEPSGTIADMAVLRTQDTLAHIPDDLPLTGRGQNIMLGYVRLFKDIHLLSLKGRELRKEEIVLEQDDGSSSECWVFRAGDEKRLFVLRNMAWSRMIPHLDYDWIYCYRLGDKGPVLEGKGALEKGTMNSKQVKCAPAGNDVLIWQMFGKSTSDETTVRVAKWNKSGKLAWKVIDTEEGEQLKQFVVDPNDGSKAIVGGHKYMKGGESSYIQYAVGPGSTKPVPIKLARSGDIIRLLRVFANRIWLGGTRYRNSIRITIFDDNFAEQTVKTFATNKAKDIALAEKDGKCYLIVLRAGDLVIKDIATLPELN